MVRPLILHLGSLICIFGTCFKLQDKFFTFANAFVFVVSPLGVGSVDEHKPPLRE